MDVPASSDKSRCRFARNGYERINETNIGKRERRSSVRCTDYRWLIKLEEITDLVDSNGILLVGRAEGNGGDDGTRFGVGPRADVDGARCEAAERSMR